LNQPSVSALFAFKILAGAAGSVTTTTYHEVGALASARRPVFAS
jgi:hypothetical protein